MTVSDEAYKTLEDIVGSKYISREPADLESYCFVWGNELLFGDKFSPRPPAVIMPENTEEVQAIVKTCNRFGLKYRAHATGFEVAALSSDTPFIPIDLRRMNRIVEIDERNRIAVVEPYVSQAKLFLETRKLGLRPNMLSSGPSCSVMAGTAAHFGSGASNNSTDYGSRNLLGVEWVLPDGELIRLGSLGCSGEWVNADGPGPSLRGVLRGTIVSVPGIGGLGILQYRSFFPEMRTKLSDISSWNVSRRFREENTGGFRRGRPTRHM